MAIFAGTRIAKTHTIATIVLGVVVVTAIAVAALVGAIAHASAHPSTSASASASTTATPACYATPNRQAPALTTGPTGILNPIPDSAYPDGLNPTEITVAQYTQLDNNQQRAVADFMVCFEEVPVTTSNISALQNAVNESTTIEPTMSVSEWVIEMIDACGGTYYPGNNLYIQEGGTC